MAQSAAVGREAVRLNRASWFSGPKEMILVDGNLREKHPAEEVAFLRNYNPLSDRFIEAPQRPFEIWCPGPCCRKTRPPDAFHKDRSRPTGRQVYCKECTKARRKTTNQRKAPSGHWYR